MSTFLPIFHRFIVLPAMSISYLLVLECESYPSKLNNSNIGKYCISINKQFELLVAAEKQFVFHT